MPRRYRTNTCLRCREHCETQTHRYARCDWVVRGWFLAREIMVEMEPDLEEISSKNLIHLNFPRVEREADVLWVLSQYLQYVEDEVVIQEAKITSGGLLGHLKYQREAAKHIAMPNLGVIPLVED